MVSVVSRIFFAGKIETLGGFMKHDKKINWNLSGAALGPRVGAEAGAEVRGPSLGTNMGFNIFDFPHFMNTTQGFQVFMQNMREYHQKFQK